MDSIARLCLTAAGLLRIYEYVTLLFLLICGWIYGNCSKWHIESYEIIDFKDFKTLQPAKDCEDMNETYTEGRPFHCV